MSKIKRLKVFFIDKDTMTRVDNPQHVIIHVDLENNLVATYYTDKGKKEVELRIEEEIKEGF